jgi:hypothetical protein
MCIRNSTRISSAVVSNTGRLSQTKYYLSNFSSTTTIIRRHHPLHGQALKLLSVGKTTVVVRLADGSSMKILRRWTDVDGVACTELAGDSVLSLRGLHELLGLFVALRERTGRQAAIAGEMITTAAPGPCGVRVRAPIVAAPGHRTPGEPAPAVRSL